MPIHGYDPLETLSNGNQELLNKVAHRNVQNILKSYTGFYDVFAEALQNALDAIERKAKTADEAGKKYVPKIWINIDLKARSIRVSDNGVGMSEEEFKLCFTPNVSFKTEHKLRGQKGVGATFLAYGFPYVKLQSKQGESKIAGVIRGGRQWADDATGKLLRPVFEEMIFDVCELDEESTGASVEVHLGDTKPKRLDWQGASKAHQWFEVLRIKTPLGGVYLNTPPFTPIVAMSVIDIQGVQTSETRSAASYYFPHEIPDLRVKDLDEIRTKLDSIPGDPATKAKHLPEDFKKLDCIYSIWPHDDILDPESSLGLSSWTEEEEALIHRHRVIAYGAFVDSTSVWDELNDSVLHLREGYRILRGGLQMASDFMVQGELITIPLTKAIGYQNNTHVIVHFTEGSPDLGRKTFQPEYHLIAEKIASQVVKTLTRYRGLLRPDTGSVVMAPDKELHEWKKEQEVWRDSNPLNLGNIAPGFSILSEPREEQDVIALFHELIGTRTIRGMKFYSAKINERYDALFQMLYDSDDMRFNKKTCPLGVGKIVDIPYESEPKVLEYKFDFDSLVADFQKDIKYPKHIDLVVCWRATGQYSSMMELKPLLVANNGNDRIYFSATHAAYRLVGGVSAEFEVVILQDLVKFLLQPESEEANQKALYASLGH